jgi:lysozyme family protein
VEKELQDKTRFLAVMACIDASEGEFSDDPHDPGNWTGGRPGQGDLKGTKYGISAKSYPHLDIKNLTYEDALKLFYQDYWLKVRGDEVPVKWALVMMDCAVNQGAVTAILWAQDAAGVMVDGKFGKRTMAALHNDDDNRKWARFMTRRTYAYLQTPGADRYGSGWIIRLFCRAIEAGIFLKSEGDLLDGL